MDQEQYQDPVAQRYASAEMQNLFSPLRRALTWRDVWIALAKVEQEAGLPVTLDQVRALEEARDRIDLDRVSQIERETRHDVMAHIRHYGEVAPEAAGVIHLGATSCFVTDNADLMIIKTALCTVRDRLLRVIHALASHCRENAAIPTLGLTHLQPAQLTTVGKRASLWLQDLVDCYRQIEDLIAELPLRGLKGTTGTQATFLQLCAGDGSRVDSLERALATELGFEKVFDLCGQTYPRLWDHRISCRLTDIAVAMHKAATDIRLLQSFGEAEEPYEQTQVGSSAMPYKRNPMRSERICALSRQLMTIAPGLAQLAANQWMERTLDDSAQRRVAIPSLFLTIDAILLAARNVFSGLIIHHRVRDRRIAEHLPFMAAEELLMEGVARGGDRQELHERIREYSWKARESVLNGEENPLRTYIESDSFFSKVASDLPPWEPVRFTGRAEEQTLRYLDEVVDLLPKPDEDHLTELKV
ncbi:MAG: adenylosuccinate lyase [Planctomycetota bacterium]|nr:adenylosuccinate lyase [Planctomycetota bacterium]